MTTTTFHDFERQYETGVARLRRLRIPAANKDLLLGFDGLCAAQGLGLARRCALLWRLSKVSTDFLPVDFRAATNAESLSLRPHAPAAVRSTCAGGL